MGQQRFVTKEDVFRWMEKGCASGIQPGLERMEWALERLGHPERRLKFIHIAGTNGKGSTAAMIAQVLRQAGYSTGMFISPYVTEWNERISVDGRPIPGLLLCPLGGTSAPAGGGDGPGSGQTHTL